MPSINLSQLRNTRQLRAWLKAGQTVVLRERGHELGRIVPEAPAVVRPIEWPDAGARRKSNFGDRVIPFVGIHAEERENRR